MLLLPSNWYAQWRWQGRSASVLQEGAEPSVPKERLLQMIWQHQRIRRDQLTTTDGRSVRILHPGFWNHEAGPDFRSAIVQYASDAPVSGDIELDLEPHHWRSHGHDTNRNYRNVVLHVVWNARIGAQVAQPTLSLQPVLDAPLEELVTWLGAESGTPFPATVPGQCCAPLRELSSQQRQEILQQAAQVRLQAKARHLETRARHAGWEQALWEGVFSALGYKHNVWPMRRLAELLPECRAAAGQSTLHTQARLLGLSGLLPTELPHRQKSSDEYIQKLWEIWWRERDAWSALTLPRTAWRLGGLRPANHPQRRLALAAGWLARADFVECLENWFSTTIDNNLLVESLLEILRDDEDGFWRHHWTFTSPRLGLPQPLIGPPRVTDLAMNILLPWFWMRAVTGRNEKLQQVAEHRYFAWPKSEDNAVLKLARQRLLGTATTRELNTAAAQQGLLQIVRDFCEHSNALCDNCRFPELVKAFPR